MRWPGLAAWHGNPWAALVVLSLGFFMTLLDLTIVNVAVPDMAADLDTSIDGNLWSLGAYPLALTVLLITGGRLGDVWGRRPVFVIGTLLFTVASMLCGLATGPVALVAARALQGVGAALMLPQTMALIVGVFPADRRGTAWGIWGAVGGVAAIAGPVLGGLLVGALGWRSIFFMNAPVGILVIALAFAIIPDVRPGRRHRLDLVGIVLASAGLCCLTFAVIEGERYGWNGWIWATFGCAAALLAAFGWQQRSAQAGDPLVPFGLFGDRKLRCDEHHLDHRVDGGRRVAAAALRLLPAGVGLRRPRGRTCDRARPVGLGGGRAAGRAAVRPVRGARSGAARAVADGRGDDLGNGGHANRVEFGGVCAPDGADGAGQRLRYRAHVGVDTAGRRAGAGGRGRRRRRDVAATRDGGGGRGGWRAIAAPARRRAAGQPPDVVASATQVSMLLPIVVTLVGTAACMQAPSGSVHDLEPLVKFRGVS